MSKLKRTEVRALPEILVAEAGLDPRSPASPHATQVCADEGICSGARVFAPMWPPPSWLAVHQEKSVWPRARVLKRFAAQRVSNSYLCLLALNPAALPKLNTALIAVLPGNRPAWGHGKIRDDLNSALCLSAGFGVPHCNMERLKPAHRPISRPRQDLLRAETAHRSWKGGGELRGGAPVTRGFGVCS